jgi:hypothetical protein
MKSSLKVAEPLGSQSANRLLVRYGTGVSGKPLVKDVLKNPGMETIN